MSKIKLNTYGVMDDIQRFAVIQSVLQIPNSSGASVTKQTTMNYDSVENVHLFNLTKSSSI